MKNNNSKKIILFCHQSGNLYGSDRVCLEIIKILSKEFRIILVLDSEGPLIYKAKKHTKKIFVYKLGVLRRKKPLLKFFWEFILAFFYLNILINNYKPIKTVTNTSVIFSLAFISKIKKIPHIWIIHEQPRNLIEKMLISKIINFFSKKRILPSKHISKELGFRNSTIIPFIEKVPRVNNIIVNKIKQRWTNNKHSIVVVGCAGMIHPNKRQDYFIKIAELIIKKNKNIRFVLLGDIIEGYEKYYKKILSSIIKINLEDTYFFYEGFKEEIINWIAALDIIVIPSVYETLSLVLQESMKLGKAIIASDIEPLKSFIKNDFNGYLIPKNDINKFAQTILELVKDKKKRKAISINAKKSYKNIFNYKKFSKEILENFKNL